MTEPNTAAVDPAILVLCTAPAEGEAAEKLARGLVEQKLAACVNMVPQIRSFYRWQGEVQDDREVQLLIKTRQSHFDALAQWLDDNHPYDVPEVLALPIAAGAASYMAWLYQQTLTPR